MHSEPRFLQGTFLFEGAGLESPVPLEAEALTFTVPAGRYAQPTYVRAGNSSDVLIYLLLRRNGMPMRYFPIGARDDTHVALAVVEDLPPGTVLDLLIGAPAGVTGIVVLDLGIVLTNHEY
jgi:hypothetical protein